MSETPLSKIVYLLDQLIEQTQSHEQIRWSDVISIIDEMKQLVTPYESLVTSYHQLVQEASQMNGLVSILTDMRIRSCQLKEIDDHWD
jgi:hypothetical protein